MKNQQQAMVVKCAVCGDAFHICAIPYCYSDKSFQRDLRMYAKSPEKYTIEVTDDYNFNYCEHITKQK